MPSTHATTPFAASRATPQRRESDEERLTRLRRLAETSPERSEREGWAWLQELCAPAAHYRLPWLFAQGTAPESPDGDCEGIVMNLHGSSWLVGLDRLVRLGQWLGGIGWTGKSFSATAGTGYNRLTKSSRIAATIALPRYAFRTQGDELIGFPFYHALESSPVAPHGMVRSITYDAPEHGNPLVLPRTRDELVEIVPGVYLGRALLRGRHGWDVVGYFGLRAPRATGAAT
ncbi:MAG: hypothetical protein R3B40_22980 [Polyangiales bacterium]|nr:hypothetical protein [Myxococcales bacterium]